MRGRFLFLQRVLQICWRMAFLILFLAFERERVERFLVDFLGIYKKIIFQISKLEKLLFYYKSTNSIASGRATLTFLFLIGL